MKYAFLFFLFSSSVVLGQSQEDSVKIPISNFFDGMRRSDTVLMRSALAPGAMLQSVSFTREKVPTVRTEDINAFISYVGTPHPEVLDERIVYDGIKIDANLASVWTPYQFFTGKKFSHCGVNSFQLVRLKEGWKIQYIIDTRRKDNCK